MSAPLTHEQQCTRILDTIAAAGVKVECGPASVAKGAWWARTGGTTFYGDSLIDALGQLTTVLRVEPEGEAAP